MVSSSQGWLLDRAARVVGENENFSHDLVSLFLAYRLR